MKDLTLSTLYDDWDVEGGSYVSPLLDKGELQIGVFADQIKDGSIEATITPLEGLQDEVDAAGRKEANLLFRYSSGRCYCAGLGSFGHKFLIAMIKPDGGMDVLKAVGRGSSIGFGKAYNLRVEFVGRRITLFENGVEQISVADDTYQSGQCGLRTFKTRARFEHVGVFPAPRCFVVMPFSPKLTSIYKVIERVVDDQGLTCIRADKIHVSRPVINDIKDEIRKADLVIVDFTDKNPNVYYEAGLADAWDKKCVILAQSEDDLTFDVRHVRTIFYSNEIGGDEKLQDNLIKAIRETMPLTPGVRSRPAAASRGPASI